MKNSRVLDKDLVWDTTSGCLEDMLENMSNRDRLDLFKVCGRTTAERSRLEIRQLLTQMHILYQNELASYDSLVMNDKMEKDLLNKFIVAVNMYKMEMEGYLNIICEDKKLYLYRNFYIELTEKGEKAFHSGQLEIPVSMLRYNS